MNPYYDLLNKPCGGTFTDIFIHDPNSGRSAVAKIPTTKGDEARGLIRSGVIDSGMIPKVEACLETLDQGVSKVHIIDGRLRHSLLLEVYTTQGVGTQIFRDAS